MVSPPSITVVTRTQGRPRFLERCLDSLLAQTRGDWRLVVVNDAGPAAEVDRVIASRASALAGRAEVRHRAVSEGMEAASNFGFAGATTPWFTLLDDDDTWAPTFLERILPAAMGLAPDMAGVVCRTVVVRERLVDDTFVEVDRKPFNPDLVAVSFEELASGNCFTNNAFVFRREVYERLRGFDERLRVYGDWDFALRVLLTHDLAVLPEALAHYHLRDHGPAPNSFQAIPHAAEVYRARLVNAWIRGEGGRSPTVGMLLTWGKARREARDRLARIDKYLDALHRLRRLSGLNLLERLLLGP